MVSITRIYTLIFLHTYPLKLHAYCRKQRTY
jgi:hypothetical protein